VGSCWFFLSFVASLSATGSAAAATASAPSLLFTNEGFSHKVGDFLNFFDFFNVMNFFYVL